MVNKLIELQGVTAGYKDRVILRDVDFTVYEKDFIGVIGANGSGKTTLLRVILGLVQPFSGRVHYYRNGDRNSNFIGYLPQFNLVDRKFPALVKDVVLSGLLGTKRLPGRYSASDRERGLNIMDKFGIGDLKDSPLGTLSGGQMQRTFLCRALISSPRILVLDEPSTYVDSTLSLDLENMLDELNRELAIILVSHDVGSVLRSVKSIACVDGTLHYHKSEEFSGELMEKYGCPIKMIGHGDIPHTVLKKHGE